MKGEGFIGKGKKQKEERKIHSRNTHRGGKG